MKKNPFGRNVQCSRNLKNVCLKHVVRREVRDLLMLEPKACKSYKSVRWLSR